MCLVYNKVKLSVLNQMLLILKKNPSITSLDILTCTVLVRLYSNKSYASSLQTTYLQTKQNVLLFISSILNIKHGCECTVCPDCTCTFVQTKKHKHHGNQKSKHYPTRTLPCLWRTISSHGGKHAHTSIHYANTLFPDNMAYYPLTSGKLL